MHRASDVLENGDVFLPACSGGIKDKGDFVWQIRPLLFRRAQVARSVT